MPDTTSPRKAARPHESPQMRLAQLPTARQTRHTILQAPLPRIRAAARQRRSKRIQRRTPQGETEMGAGHGYRHHADLREMQSASPAITGMGPRPHRRPQGLDRPRTPKLQPKRRTTQSERLSRALALMPHPVERHRSVRRKQTHATLSFSIFIRRHRFTSNTKQTKQHKTSDKTRRKPNDRHPGGVTLKR